MKKEWYIFKGTSHHGPYSLQELSEFMTSGELTLQSLVWKEGAEKWEALGKIPEILSFLEKGTAPATPTEPERPVAPVKQVEPVAPKRATAPTVTNLPKLPDLPDLPEDDAPPSLPPFLSSNAPKTIVEEEIEDVPPPVPLDALLMTKGEKQSVEGLVERISVKNGRKLLLAGVAVLVIALVGWFISNEWTTKSEINVKGIMPVYLERLQETANLSTPSLVVTMALSLDGKSIWVSTNKSGTIAAIIKMQSLPMRILGNQPVTLTVKGIIDEHLGKFDKMQMTEGTQFVPGEYKIHFTGRKIHWINKNFKMLSNFSIFRKLNTSYNYQGDALIYAGTPREFEKKILEYHEAVIGEKLKPYQDKMERLQTLQSLLNKTAESYLLALEKMSKGSEIKQFEDQYLREISPIVQSLVIAANDISQNKAFQEEDFRNPIAPYKEQIHLGKQIGEMASDMITETKKIKNLTAKEKNLLKARFENRYRAIKLQLDINITKLQAYMQSISK